jgi:hypothetical protein
MFCLSRLFLLINLLPALAFSELTLPHQEEAPPQEPSGRSPFSHFEFEGFSFFQSSNQSSLRPASR